MDRPSLGVSREDPGKYVLGTVPVEADGSAYFRIPSGIPVFFQALDEKGMAVQTMRTLTYVLPRQTLSCVGCHESRETSPNISTDLMATRRKPSKITPGPNGTWPLRFDRLVQPVLNQSCVRCHNPNGKNKNAARFDLTSTNAYNNLLSFADKDLEKLVFEKDMSKVGHCPARESKLLKIMTEDKNHGDVHLDQDSFNRLVTWMDTYAQKQGSFSEKQEQELIQFRRKTTSLFNH
jgi:hypothetical protein